MDIKLRKDDKKQISNPDDVYGIMQRILLRENKIDREKEHFWIIGMNLAGYILYIELISLGSVRETPVEPMNVFRVAVMKNATRVIAVHNHPSGNMTPSDADKDITDRLIQVGKILNIELDDHLIISPTTYMSFKNIGLMNQLEESLKYVPTYQVIEQIRKEEKAIAREALKAERDQKKKLEAEKERLLLSAVGALLDKEMNAEEIAAILEIKISTVYKMLRKKAQQDRENTPS